MLALTTTRVHTFRIKHQLFDLMRAYVSFYTKQGEYRQDHKMKLVGRKMGLALEKWNNGYDDRGDQINIREIAENDAGYQALLEGLQELCKLLPEANTELDDTVAALMTKEVL